MIFIIFIFVLLMFLYVILSSYQRRQTGKECLISQMFLNLVENIFAFREATLVFAIKANISRSKARFPYALRYVEMKMLKMLYCKQRNVS